MRSVLHYDALEVEKVEVQAGPMAAVEVAGQQREEERASQGAEAGVLGLQPSRTVPAAGRVEAEEVLACFYARGVVEAQGAREIRRYFHCYAQLEMRDAAEVAAEERVRLHLEAEEPCGAVALRMVWEVSRVFLRGLLARTCEGV